VLDLRQAPAPDADCDKSPILVGSRWLDFPKILQYLNRGGAANI
jgi:hypothetical protein